TGATEQFQRHGLVLSPAACTVGWVNDAIIFPARLGDSTNLWRAAISPSSWRIARPPQRLTFGTALEVHPSAGRNGEVVFSSLSENVDVWSLRMEANQAVVTSEMERLTESTGRDIFPSVSADGSRMAFVSDKAGYPNVWLKDLETAKETPLTVTP